MNHVEEVKKGLLEVAEAVSEMKANQKREMRDFERKFEAKSNREALGMGGQLEHSGTASATMTGTEKKALEKFLRSGDDRELKALNMSSDPQGGYTVPSSMAAQLATVAASSSPMRSLANGVSPASADYQQPVCTSGPGAEWLSEQATRNVTTDPAFAMVRPPSGELSAIVSVTRWLLEDSAFDLAAFVVKEAGRSFGASEGEAWINGSGINRPAGLLIQASAETADATRPFGTIEYVDSGTAAGIADALGGIDGLIDMLHALKPEYRANATWLASNGALRALRKLKDGEDRYILTPSLVAGQPDMLLGKPIYEDPFMPAPGADAFPIAVADWKRAYTITDIGSPVLIRDDVTVKGRVLFYIAKRVGGAVVDTNAVKLLRCSA